MYFYRKIIIARNLIDESAFTDGVKSVVQEALGLCGGKSVREIICYGLGNFTDCNTSRYQLAFLLFLREFLKASVLIHDPVFYECEVNILKELEFSLIEENEEGKHQISEEGLTFLYLPHCPKQLVNNFLWKNWGPSLSNCLIFGNSFSATVDRLILSENNLKFLMEIQPYVQELRIDNNFKFLDVFNDTSLHVFPEDKIKLVQPSVWSYNTEEPVYLDSDIELIKKKL